MSDELVFIDVSEIVPGKIEDVRAAFSELAAFVETNEPSAISYEVFFSDDERTVTVLQRHPDSASMEFHMKAGAELFRRFRDLLTMRSMQIFGEPSDALLEAMQAKAHMLGAPGVEVHSRSSGFGRSR